MVFGTKLVYIGTVNLTTVIDLELSPGLTGISVIFVQ